MPQETTIYARAAGWLLLAGSAVVLVGFAMHPPGEGISYEQTRQLVIDENALWRASHGLAGAGFLLVAAGALVVLLAQTRWTASSLLAGLWALLAVASLPLALALALEASTLANPEVTGDAATFARWYGFVDGLFPAMAAITLSMLGIAWQEYRNPGRATPKWVALVGLVGAAGFLVYFGVAHVGRLTALANLFVAFFLAILWFGWLGWGIARAAGPTPTPKSAAPAKPTKKPK